MLWMSWKEGHMGLVRCFHFSHICFLNLFFNVLFGRAVECVLVF